MPSVPQGTVEMHFSLYPVQNIQDNSRSFSPEEHILGKLKKKCLHRDKCTAALKKYCLLKEGDLQNKEQMHFLISLDEKVLRF